MLAAFGYRPSPGPLIATTGVFTLLAAPFGGHSVNLSSIIAALCAGEDASPDPARRWIAAASNGAACVVFGLLAGGVAHFVAGSPILVEAVAGLALLNAFGGALCAARSPTPPSARRRWRPSSSRLRASASSASAARSGVWSSARRSSPSIAPATSARRWRQAEAP